MNENKLRLDLDDEKNELRPEYIPAGLLAKIIAGVESVIAEAADKPDDSELPAIALVGITEGSVLNDLRVGPWARSAVLAVLSAVQTGDYSKLPPKAHKKLLELSKIICQNNLSARLHGTGEFDVEISARHPIPQIRQKLVKSRTRIYGEVQSVGGEKPAAAIRLFSTGKQLSVSADAEIVKDLGKRLYERVGIVGEATVDLVSGEYISFKVERILNYRGRDADPVSAIERIENLFPGKWEGVNPDEFVNELRGDGD